MTALDTAVTAARAGAAELLAARGGDLQIAYKDARANLVTVADTRSQAAITRVILQAFPEHAVDGEEGRAGPPDAANVWYVDPLDGTTNFSRGMPFYCVSIALRSSGETALGVVYDPIHDELFTAGKDKGAFLNGRPCLVSGTASVDRAVVVAQAQTSAAGEIRAYAELVERLMLVCGGVRSFGSPALALCAIACGRLDAYCEHAMDAWDILAGQLILAEAGGTLTTFSGAPHTSVKRADVVASNGMIHAELMTALKGLLCLTSTRPCCP